MEALLQQITSLRRATTKFGPAPHKPILLLAILESFDKGEIDSNWIGIDEALLARFYDLWNLIVQNTNTPNFALTFFHLGNERRGLWKLKVIPGKAIITAHKFAYKSLNVLKETFLGAQFSDEFYIAITNLSERNMLRLALLKAYFPDYTIGGNGIELRYTKEIENQILYNKSESHELIVNPQITDEAIETLEEQVILRNYIFRKAVLETYNYQCAVSGLKIESSEHELLIDACHIVPLTRSSDDSIGNGIALSPTPHRAFATGLIAIDDNYRILVNRKLKDCTTAAGIRLYEHKPILLPREEQFYPSLHRLAEHRVRFGFE